MKIKNEDIDKLQGLVKDIGRILEDIERKKEDDGKVSWFEGISLAAENIPAAFSLYKNGAEIGDEILDLEESEVKELAETIVSEMDGQNSALVEIAENIVNMLIHAKKAYLAYLKTK